MKGDTCKYIFNTVFLQKDKRHGKSAEQCKAIYLSTENNNNLGSFILINKIVLVAVTYVIYLQSCT
jgi:hypothetical protein